MDIYTECHEILTYIGFMVCLYQYIRLTTLNINDQNIDSTSCGYWVLAFLFYMTNTKGPMLDRMKKFDKKFDNKKTIENEIDLKKYIDKIYFK